MSDNDELVVRCPDCGKSTNLDQYQTQDVCERVLQWSRDEDGELYAEEVGKEELIDATTNGYRCDALECPGRGRLLQWTDLKVEGDDDA